MKRFRMSLFAVILAHFCSCRPAKDERLLREIVVEYQTVIAKLPPNTKVSLDVVTCSMESDKQQEIERLVRERKIFFYDHAVPESAPESDLPLLVYYPKRLLIMRSGAAQESSGKE